MIVNHWVTTYCKKYSSLHSRNKKSTMLWLSALVLLLNGLLRVEGILDIEEDPLCCSTSCCKPIKTLPLTACQGVMGSPIYEVGATANSYNQDVDGICITFFPITQCDYLVFKVVTSKNGSQQINVFYQSQSALGTIRSEGHLDQSGESSIVLEDRYYGLPCENVFVSYRCTLFGGCSTLDSLQECGDQRAVLSSSSCVSPFCFWLATSLGKSQFTDTEWIQYPYSQQQSCVATFNGAPCLNIDCIPTDQRIDVPNAIDAALQGVLATTSSVVTNQLDLIYEKLDGASLEQIQPITDPYSMLFADMNSMVN